MFHLPLKVVTISTVQANKSKSRSDFLGRRKVDRVDFIVAGVQKAGTTDVEKVIAALPGLETPNLTGGIAKVLPNHHITKPVFIGEVRADGQFDVVSKTGLVPGDAWSDYLPGSKDIDADWVTLKCGNYNKVTKKCSGQNYK